MLDSISDRVAAGIAGRKVADAIAAGLRGEPLSQPDATQADATEDSRPAVIKAIAAFGVDETDPRAAWDALMAERGYSVWGEERAKLAEEKAAATFERARLRFELGPMERARGQLADNEQRYDTLRNTEPVPATELKGAAKEAALRLVRQLGYPVGGPHDTTQFDREGIRYIFHRDGKVEAHDADVPTSREQKSQWMDMLDRQITLGRRDPADLMNRHDELTARIDELSAVLERKKA